MKRGEVYWADLVPRSGSEQTGRRPVVVVSHDGFNENESWMSIIVVPLSTSDSQHKRSLTTVAVPAGVAGIPKPSVLVCHQVTTLDRTKLSKKIGTLPEKFLWELEDALKTSLDLT